MKFSIITAVKKDYLNLVKFFFLIFFLSLLIKCIFIYPGNKFIYLIFSIISNFYLIYSLRKKSFFIDFFLSLFLWLGIWFKFSVQMIFFKNKFPEGVGNFDFSPSSYDNVLIISFFSLCSLIITSFLVKRFFFNYKKNYKKTNQINNFINFSKKKNNFHNFNIFL